MKTTDFLSRLRNVKKVSNGWAALCPAHDDHNPSLSIREGKNGETLLYCHAGCENKKIIEAMELKMSDLFPDKQANGKRRRVAAYDYNDLDGNLLYQKLRYVPKGFGERRPDGNGGWIWKLKGVKRILYRLPKVVEAVKTNKIIFIVDGEKDVDTVEKLGLTATCNPFGNGEWRASYTQTLTSGRIVIIADKDESGRNHAQLVARNLFSKVKLLQMIELPSRNDSYVKDVSDWIQAGGTLDELQELVKATPQWEPAKVSENSEDDTIAIQAQFFKIWQNKGLNNAERYKKMTEVVLNYLHKRGRFFFHADYKNHSTAMFFDSRRKLLLQLASNEFQSWLSIYIGINRTEHAFKFIFAALEDEALVGKTTGLQPEIFWAARPGAIYLSNGDGQAMKITANKVKLVDNGTDDVLFAAGHTLRPWKLTNPVDPVESCRLFSDMKAVALHAKDLFRLWLCSLPTNQRCKPPLVSSGPVGSGKTRLAYGVFELYGMTPRIAAITDGGEDDFWTTVDGGGLVCWDNADTKNKWLPDALAAAATDGIHEKRRLYTDSIIIQQRTRSWTIVTSANPIFAADPGLADRVLVIRLERRKTETAESELSDEIIANRDSGMSWIAQTLSKTLADRDPVPKNLNQRHPDFAAFAVHIGRAIGREQEAIDALQAAEADKPMFNLENDDMGNALFDLMLDLESFEGTAAELLDELKKQDSYFENWTPKRIGKRLQKLWPHLESIFQAKQDKQHGGILRYVLRVNKR